MMHLLSFVLAALATSKAFAAPIEGSAAADALIPETISGSVEARQLDGLSALGGLVGGLPVPSGILRRGLGDGSLEFDSLNIPMPTGGVPALNVRQGGPLDPVAAAPSRLPLPLSLIPAGGDASPTGTQEIGAGGGGGGGGGISFPNVLVAKPAAAPAAAEVPAVEDSWHPSSPASPARPTFTWNPDYASYTNSWWHQPSAGLTDDVAKGPIPTGNSANIGGHNVNLPRADDPAPTAAPATSTDAPSWASWTDWQTWTSQWGQFSNAANGASAYSWTQTWDGAAVPTYTWPAWNGEQGQNQNPPPAAPTGAVRAAVAPGAAELPPKGMNAGVGKGAISASAAGVEAKATAA